VTTRLYLLNACTILFLMTLGAVASRSVYSDARWTVQAAEGEAQRNERSTPRSFILPATPAVTEEQEQQARGTKDGLDVFRCLGTLRALGYRADDTPPALRAQNLEAIFDFQKAHGLKTTARLDGETVRKLKCQD
jgi:hypothetical protein